MRLIASLAPPWDQDAEGLAIPVTTDQERSDTMAELERRIGGDLAELRRIGALKAKPWEAALIPVNGIASRFVLAIGVGDAAAFDRVAALRLGAAIVRRLSGCDVRRLAIHLPDRLSIAGGVSQPDLTELAVRGVVEGSAEPATLYRDRSDALPPVL